ncbi:hypothetical protein PENDEC_c057G01877 [Penicillium decumbens]|uniref:Uncharacterized protein n=1 Tax=Penicillium decumbens TaxID=69771 RepID=A0A1V6NNK7_PENDC|nr:hypothetical protein PENDEC_c057G01877 [Penicillium decumbens]
MTAPRLQARIDEVPYLHLAEAILAIKDLVMGAVVSVNSHGSCTIHHPNYEGAGHLESLGKLFLDSADRCQEEHASLQLRLLHHSLDSVIYDIFEEGFTVYREGVKNGTILPELKTPGCCACCVGEPAAIIGCNFHGGKALLFDEQEYRQLWGDAEGVGAEWRNWVDGKGWAQHWIYASKEQAEEALSRDLAMEVSSML